MDTLILHRLIPLHWSIAGALLGMTTLLLLWLTNHRLGISTGFENLCALGSKFPYFQRQELQGPGRWRLTFVSGLVVGGFLSAWLSGGWTPFWDLGMFDTMIRGGPLVKLIWMFIGGLFIGFGTRLAGGCTSGHGIFGLSNFERSSFVTLFCYMLAGMATTHLIYRVIVTAW